jgi:hypothetical protein
METNDIVETSIDTVEITARAGGWRPKDEFTGDEKNWYPADEFLRRGDLLAEISKRGHENKQLRESFDMIARKFEMQEKKAYEDALAKLRQEKDFAIDVGDRNKVYDIENKIAEVNRTASTPISTGPQPEVMEFVNKHSAWFNDNTPQNAGYKAEAIAYDKQLPADMSVTERLAKTEHYMMTRINNHSKDSVQVQSGESKPTKSSGKKNFDHLSTIQKTICDKFIKMGVFKTRQDYVNELDKQGDL